MEQRWRRWSPEAGSVEFDTPPPAPHHHHQRAGGQSLFNSSPRIVPVLQKVASKFLPDGIGGGAGVPHVVAINQVILTPPQYLIMLVFPRVKLFTLKLPFST